MNPHGAAIATQQNYCFHLICYWGIVFPLRMRTITCRSIDIFLLQGGLIINKLLHLPLLVTSAYIHYGDSKMQPPHLDILKRYPFVMPPTSSQIVDIDYAITKLIITKGILVTKIQNKLVW